MLEPQCNTRTWSLDLLKPCGQLESILVEQDSTHGGQATNYRNFSLFDLCEHVYKFHTPSGKADIMAVPTLRLTGQRF